MHISSKNYSNLLKELELSPLEDYKLPFMTKKELGIDRPGGKYCEEYQCHYLYHHFMDRNHHYLKGEKLLNPSKKGEEPKAKRYLVQISSCHILNDPWEEIDHYFNSDLIKLRDTLADHIYFNIIYELDSNIIDRVTPSILKRMELYELFPTRVAVEHYLGNEIDNPVRKLIYARDAKNEFCLYCGAGLDYKNINTGACNAFFCENQNTHDKKNNGCDEKFLNSKAHKDISELLKQGLETEANLKTLARTLIKKTSDYILNLDSKVARKPKIPILSSNIETFLSEKVCLELIEKLQLQDHIRTYGLNHLFLNITKEIYHCLDKIHRRQKNGKPFINWDRFIIRRQLIEEHIKSVLSPTLKVT